ncbi:MAG: hypothetical protein Q9178_002945 [Gyalolechia marmorata]
MTGLENAEEPKSTVYKPSVQCADSWTGTMAKHYLSIFTAWTFAAVPLAILAIAFFTVVEHNAWLNFSVSTVQFLAQEPLPSNDPVYSNFTPGRGLSPLCSDLPIERDQLPGGRGVLSYCLSLSQETEGSYMSGTSASSSYQNATKSEDNTILSTPEGWLIMPVNPPADMDFYATTFGSLTQCKEATSLCNAEVSSTKWLDAYCLFDCKRDRAGLDFTGNLSDLSFGTPTFDRGFVFADYTDSSMTSLNHYGYFNPGPTRWHAVLLEVQARIITGKNILSSLGSIGDPVTNEANAPLLGPYGNNERVSGILSCTTTLSDVSYFMVNGSLTVNTWTAMNSSASHAFVSNLHLDLGPGSVLLQRGLHAFMLTADTSDDITSGWATTYDKTILAQGIPMLVGRPPLRVVQRITTQVTRIPRAPFITLISLALLYSALGTCLMIAALIAVRKGQGVEDVQARLSTLAVVAESFESPGWSDDAKDVDMLFAERRGEPTRRVALARRQDGGRRFKQIVIRRHYMKSPCPPAASGNEDICVQSSSGAASGQAEK